MIFEHDYEPVPGLPAPLPGDETILWQGAPRWNVFARRALKIRWIVGYFAVLIVWGVADRLASGAPAGTVALALAQWLGLAAMAVGLLLLFAWAVGRTTLYTVTNRRVVMRFGIALPMTLQIPFRRIDGAALKAGADGAGDIALTLLAGDRIAYLVLWPHARPWRLAKAEPTLRGLADATDAARILARALAASAEQPAKAVTIQVVKKGETGAPAPAAA
ncbi:MAG TPA: photosynthetic complex putative assembly protein PuhB [Rhodopila sp.]|nr:photosynthetic complex putative assembly protein PuhB [Rhodopila sp.]